MFNNKLGCSTEVNNFISPIKSQNNSNIELLKGISLEKIKDMLTLISVVSQEDVEMKEAMEIVEVEQAPSHIPDQPKEKTQAPDEVLLDMPDFF